MGIISAISTFGGLIRPATDLTRVVRGDRAASEEMDHLWRKAVMDQMASEFGRPHESWFDCFVDGVNRLPRPALAFGTLSLFIYAMANPVSFAARMQGLALVPDQLWWLMGAIVSFYFGARELHYFRDKRPSIQVEDVMAVRETQEALEAMVPQPSNAVSAGLLGWGGGRKRQSRVSVDPNHNAALEDWKASRKQN